MEDTVLAPPRKALAGAIVLASTVFAVVTHAQSSRFDELANAPFTNGFLSKEAIASLEDELVFQRAVQSYLWGLPVLNIYGMKDGGKGVRQGIQHPADLEGQAQRQDTDHHPELRRDLRDGVSRSKG
jgi:hypothetical protein